MSNQFHQFSSLPHSFSLYFVTWIPKVDSLFVLGDLRAIFLVDMPAFLKGRLQVDGLVVVNEQVGLSKKRKKFYLIFKVNFKKTYVSDKWSFLDYMLSRNGFNDNQRCQIHACVYSSNLLVLVNGCLTQDISVQKGLKEGVPQLISFFSWWQKF